jgi:hypothetical protein
MGCEVEANRAFARFLDLAYTGMPKTASFGTLLKSSLSSGKQVGSYPPPSFGAVCAEYKGIESQS